DFVDERHGVRYGHGNPMRRAAEKEYVMGMTQVGIRNVSSTTREGYEDAISMGSTILTVRQFRALKLEDVLKKIPLEIPIYVTIDIDAFCPSIAPGTGTPSHGGFLYYEVLELLQKVALERKIIGIDMVEVAPSYDPTEKTQILAAQILMNFLGFIFSK
ncbi:MAG: arginase family protein, partial [Pseudomonadota bacterium]|nr:arginase family protein [Pseudomonadota bacterium]